MTALHLRDISAGWQGTPVLSGISVQVEAGERVALVGRSGAGKSTLLGVMYEHARVKAALLPQEQGLVQALSVFHNVYMGALDQHPGWYNIANLVKPLRRQVQAVHPLLDELGLSEHIWTPVGRLSGGQKQRTGVARALFQQASLLLADEPVSALDIPRAEKVMTLLTGRYPTSVIAMHDVELALRYCHRILGLSGGVIALDEPAARLTVQDLMRLY